MPGLKDLFFSSSRAPKKQRSRRLTRQRKLRHMTDGRLGLSFGQRWQDSPLPQPLPLPEFNRERMSVDTKRDEDRKYDSVDIKTSSSVSDRRPFSPQLADKTTKSESPPFFRRGFPRSLNDESAANNFRLNVPARSAPTSGLSSPVGKPQRFNSMDFVPQILFSSTTNENFLSNSDRHPNAPDCSPLHSPKKRSCFQNTNLHNLHPLPLPPSSPKPIPSLTRTNDSEKPEALLTKSKWVKGKLIGRGTYGTVFEAFNSETGAMCAMKEVDIITDDPKSVECIKQLEQEIKILQNLDHKNIVRYYGCEVVADHFCIYLEYIYPGSISKYVREHFGVITESVVRNFTRHILSGLAYLHSTDTVHRDIKGANLLVDAFGVVKLADFGLAKHLTVAAYDLSLKGSPHWMAPELLQAVMRKDSDYEHAYAIDIWSLGCTVVEMFNGKPPWSECTGVQALFHVLNKSPAIPESLSSEGKDFLKLCFKRNPSERPLAAQLLKHSFVRTTQEQCFSSYTLDFSGLKISNKSCSPREKPSICRLLPTSPPTNGGRSNRGSLRVATHQSPRSSLEALPSISTPGSKSKSRAINSVTTSPNSLRFASGHDYQNKNRKVRKGFFRSFEGL